MPFLPVHTGALPARFRRQRLLIIGCGDVGLRLARQRNTAGLRLYALTSSSSRTRELRDQGITPLLGNLNQPASLRRLAGLATRVVHLAPPQSVTLGWGSGVSTERDRVDWHTRHLLQSLRRKAQPAALVYVSTSGVYGDCRGEWASETREPQPRNLRAWRRLSAEQAVRQLPQIGVRSAVLRAPGIYAADRINGTPQARLEKGMPVLQAADDIYTNHIHADDLARACWLALWRAGAGRVLNVNDDTRWKMGEYFRWAAQHYGYPEPPSISLEQAKVQLSAGLVSFWTESRRMCNQRLKQELGMQLRYPTVKHGLAAGEQRTNDVP